MINKEAVNGARSLYYGFLSKMLVFSTNENRYEGVSEALDIMIQNPLDENSGEALKEIKEFMDLGGVESFIHEYDDIFNNPSKQALRTTASYYDEGFESGKKRLEVKNFLAKTKIRRDEKNYKEHEDSVGFLVTFMHELIELIVAGEKSYDTLQHCLFTEIINEFIDEFIKNLYEHDKANVYKSLAVVFNAFVEFERLYFDVAKPAPKEKVVKKQESCEFISDEEAARRKRNREAKEADTIAKAASNNSSYAIDEEDPGL
ncbi:TorD/DmsD family molecular chaperone [Sulfurospirillum arcachonense]|uniref:TorD/DmsD family molecular chaperone n=1 Tax=Sulfurospirillum arcachonense TaxID=57666 RepID=UPI00046ABE7F|nr:molecular chaperone TorD family protein [Sulfurospirillum arcachonense]